ncbi:Anaerobic selenocysteine-containing dehydrogenase [Desulfuromusa kysingii]|uniref:Anaerobic selenocysteine-containing dehydrogenase n=1 Tax=Desulfuromusa kysingii TaxID=37625 RepID=A0A1H4E2T2_9BACT|nr:molybdopterin-dependent oxidoreductase [Desulfuromusa kysingii]SEA79226.1 Anaerobic selenocysteine-containing dehydrogenase [Desulfuromusa kysingii]
MDSEISRRNFLKGAAGVSALTLSGLCFIDISPAKADTVKYPITRFRNVCPRNCHDTCGMITEVQDGKVIRVYGDPDHPITKGAMCVKGVSYIKQLYSPERQLHPMKRVGKKGEGKWQRISWDEAITTITDKFKETIAEDGNAEAIWGYWYSGTLGAVTNYSMNRRFLYKLGASRIAQTVCSEAGKEACKYTFGTQEGMDPEDFVNSKLIVSWGVNEQATNVHAFNFYNKAFEKGAKYVVVNPRRTEGAAMADMHIQPRPGTDAALALGMMNVIIAENLYDKDFVEKNTLGFKELKERVKEYPVEKVSQITDVPVKQIVEFARLYAKTDPAAIRVGFGIQRNTNGGMMVRTISCLPGLCGNWGKPGAGLLYINTNWKWNFKHLYHFDTPKSRSLNINKLGEVLLEKKDPVKALYVYNSNPLGMTANLNKVKKGLEREDLFTVVHDLFMTDTADYADIFLPASHFIEQWDFHQAYWGLVVQVNEKAVEPLGEARPNYEVFRALAKGMGYTDKTFDEDPVDIIKGALNTDDPRMKGLTFERLVKEGATRINTPDSPAVFFKDHKFPTPSGKIEFYSEQVAKHGLDPVPFYAAPLESRDGSPKLHKKYPLVLLTGATKNLLSTQWSQEAYNQEIDPVRRIEISPEDAKARGIKTGDLVRVKNDRGSIQLTALVIDTVRPGVASADKAWWPKLCPDNQNVNFLTPDTLADMADNSTYHTNLIQVEKV